MRSYSNSCELGKEKIPEFFQGPNNADFHRAENFFSLKEIFDTKNMYGECFFLFLKNFFQLITVNLFGLHPPLAKKHRKQTFGP